MTTTVADVLVIYATLPFLAAGLGVVVTGERPSRRTMLAASFAMIGVLVMVGDGLGQGRFLGQMLSFYMTAAFAGLVVVQRSDPGLPVAPINALAALLSSTFGFSVAKSLHMSAFDVADLFLFGVSTITVAFALFMEGAKHVPSAEASLIAMLDVVMGPLWVWLAFAERPSLATGIGGAFVLAAAVWRLAPELVRRREDLAPAAPLV
jgi:drug/metabolite transporter (DMT)-like permease